MKTSKEYRDQAAAALKGNYGTAIGILLVNSLIMGAIGTISFGIGIIILSGAFTVGVSVAFVNLHRRNRMTFSDLFAGFSGKVSFGSTISLSFFSGLFVMLWSMLFVVPGIIKTYAYSMAPYILADHPEMSGLQAITASKNLMKGKKGKLFCLELSYIGWVLLSILTFGILLLWVEPKMEAAKAAFYEDIKYEIGGTYDENSGNDFAAENTSAENKAADFTDF